MEEREALESILISNRRYVTGKAWQISLDWDCFDFIDDLSQEGFLCLVSKFAEFDHDLGIQFWSFARKYVYYSMLDAFYRWRFGTKHPKKHESGFYYYESDRISESFPCNSINSDIYIDANKIFSMLNGREYDVLLRYFCGDETLDDIAADYGMTRSGVGYIKNNAIKRVRKLCDKG